MPSPRTHPQKSILAFPLGGRWHGEAVTDEGAIYCQTVLNLPPHPPSLRTGHLPPKGKARGAFFLFSATNLVSTHSAPPHCFPPPVGANCVRPPRPAAAQCFSGEHSSPLRVYPDPPALQLFLPYCAIPLSLKFPFPQKQSANSLKRPILPLFPPVYLPRFLHLSPT